jgi:hypothetical protein
MKIIIWGHKLHSHVHSYIHNGFYRAFQYLNKEVYWFDKSDDVNNFDFSNSIFITEGQVDQNIPLREDCFYILHNCYAAKYKDLFEKNRCIKLQAYADTRLNKNCIKVRDCIYFDVPNKYLCMLWATDLLPEEIEKNKPQIVFNENSNVVHWIGTIDANFYGNMEEIMPFQLACADNNILFKKMSFKSVEENIRLIKESYMAPAIVGKWQQEVGYVPCRIFKNISYGQFGITNSPRIYELFREKIIFNTNTNDLFYDAKNKLPIIELGQLHELMDFVKNNHTYLNRIETIFDFISIINPDVEKQWNYIEPQEPEHTNEN